MNNRGVIVRTPAKINLQLAVGPIGADGFHEVTTVFQAICRLLLLKSTAINRRTPIPMKPRTKDIMERPALGIKSICIIYLS